LDNLKGIKADKVSFMVGIIQDSVKVLLGFSKKFASAQGFFTPMNIFFDMSRSAKEWSSPQNALAYLNVADSLPHRSEGESVLTEHLPEDTKRILDLGTGDGRLIKLIKANRPQIEAVAIDVSPTMLRSAREHFANDSKVKIIEHDLSKPLPDDLGYFDAVVSSFAIHHLRHERKRELYEEIYDIVNPTGVFCNLEHVASPSVELHVRFLKAIGYSPEKEDRANRLLPIEIQLGWLRDTGFVEVDCFWKWLEMALLIGYKA
jgi:tRNA (cmo5U34)-methyltransferase